MSVAYVESTSILCLGNVRLRKVFVAFGIEPPALFLYDNENVATSLLPSPLQYNGSRCKMATIRPLPYIVIGLIMNCYSSSIL